MATTKPRGIVRAMYEHWTREYLRELPLEHFMEMKGQSTQREITLESLALVKARRPESHLFNEMLMQYPRRGEKKPGRAVPDNMVVISKTPLEADSSFNTPLEPVTPFWVLEYVSKNNKRKDYEDNFDKCEKELKVPCYLTFYPDEQELTLYHLQGKKYATVKPNRCRRYAIPELDIEVAIVDRWVRFWYQGELLPLPGELQQQLDQANQRAEQERERADEIQRRLEEAEGELAKLRSNPPAAGTRRLNGSNGAK